MLGQGLYSLDPLRGLDPLRAIMFMASRAGPQFVTVLLSASLPHGSERYLRLSLPYTKSPLE